MRLLWLFGSLALALCLAVWSSQSPQPVGADAPATAFSSARAMADVRDLARAPHPLGSAEHGRVRARLIQRLGTDLGLSVTTQAGPLSPGSIRRLEAWDIDPATANFQAVNVVGVLGGTDPSLPAVMLMAHYDTVPGSPGAADDTTGVAAILETVRAIRARGPAPRTLVVLLTDAEELGLDGARVFFGGHPLRDRIGAVINLEARGGGGRAMMFETGRDSAGIVALFAGVVPQVPGGVTSNSLAALVYESMPNGTDFTIPKDRGIAGLNFAFIGRADQYHDPTSTPASLDQGSVQHIGTQALETADALVRARVLPTPGPNRAYADVFGRAILQHPVAVGWILLGLTGLGFAIAGLKTRVAAVEVGRGVLDGLWLVSTGLVLTQAVRLLAGPMAARAETAETYYTLLRRLPWMQAGAALTVLAVALVMVAGRGRMDRRVLAGLAVVATSAVQVFGGYNPLILGAGVVAVLLSLLPGTAPRTVWGGWLGLIALVGALGTAVQILAPTAAYLFIWIGLLAAAAAAVTALADPGLTRSRIALPAALVTIVAGGWLMAMAHPVFLGIGMDMPGVLALIGLLILTLARPMGPQGVGQRGGQAALGMAAAVLILACAASLVAVYRAPEPTAVVTT